MMPMKRIDIATIEAARPSLMEESASLCRNTMRWRGRPRAMKRVGVEIELAARTQHKHPGVRAAPTRFEPREVHARARIAVDPRRAVPDDGGAPSRGRRQLEGAHAPAGDVEDVEARLAGAASENANSVLSFMGLGVAVRRTATRVNASTETGVAS